MKGLIRGKFIFIVISISFLVCLAISVVSYSFYSTYLYAHLKQKTEMVCDRLSLTLSNQLWNFSLHDCSLIIESELRDVDVLAIILRSEDDTMYVSLGRADGARNGGTVIKSLKPEEINSLGSSAFMARQAKVLHGSEVLGNVTVFSTDRNVKSDLVSRMLTISLSSAIIGVLIALALFIAVDRLVSSRVIELSKVVNVFAGGNFSSRAEIINRDEISALGKAFNQMAEKLKTLYDDLQSSEAHYRELYDGVPTGLYRTTPDGRFVDANPALIALLGFGDRAELSDIELADLYANRQDYDHWESTLESESSLRNFEFRLQRTDGATCWVRNNAHVVTDSEGRALCYEGSLEDITVLKAAEAEQKKLIAELESKNAELARFTYTVSHDLKSPLITIKGFLGYLEKEAREGNFEDFAKDLDRITSAADKMQSLLLELLELSRIGRIANVQEESPFEQVAKEAVALVEGRLRERDIEVDLARGLPVVFGDITRLREAVENLVDNAVKFMGGQEKPRIEIGSRADGTETVFYVRDNGIGIDPHYHSKVFRLFERLDPNTEGTGMGLAIAERIIEVHGGRIWVESEGLGKGSTFCFTFPDSRVVKSE